MNNLRYYQKEAVDQIVEFYNSEVKNAKIIISTGLGITNILVHSIENILTANKNCKIVLLCSYESVVKQYISELVSSSKALNVVSFLPDIKNNGIFIDDYQNILTQAIELDYNQFDLIICSDLDILNDDYIYPFFSSSLKGTGEFWKFLMQFFNTKFVVFEYKNYAEKISQNLVFKSRTFINVIKHIKPTLF